jgi:hypothetical protein
LLSDWQRNGEVTFDCEHNMHVVVECRVVEIAITLKIIVVMTCRMSSNAATNPDFIYKHVYM